MSNEEKIDRSPRTRAEALRRFHHLVAPVIAKIRAKLPPEAYKPQLWKIAASSGVLSAIEAWQGGTAAELDAWISQGAREAILTWLRHEKGEPNPMNNLTDKEIWSILDPEERTVMTLRYGHGFGTQEIGHAWTPRKTPREVRALLGSGRVKIREAQRRRAPAE